MLRVLALNCTLKPSATGSSTDLLLRHCLEAFAEVGAEGEIVRMVDHDIKPGVLSDEGEGDAWPAIRSRIVDSDILLIGTPIWLGQPSSVCKRVLERLDAFLSETDDGGRMPSYGKVACAAVVGNEDGAHHVHAELFQALNDVGFSIAANAGTYWVGEAMHATDYKDLEQRPEKTWSATRMMARNAAHLAGLLKGAQFPGEG